MANLFYPITLAQGQKSMLNPVCIEHQITTIVTVAKDACFSMLVNDLQRVTP